MSKSELSQFKEATSYISGLPPLEEWMNFQQIRSTDPITANYIRSLFEWLGKSLDAFFSDFPDPLPSSGLSEPIQRIVRETTERYIIFALLIFQGERFVKQEAEAAGFEYPFDKQSELLKMLALEECRYEIMLSLQTHWESHSEAQRNERLRDCQKYLAGEISKELYEKRVERWNREDTKLHRNPYFPVRTMPWRSFCLYVFEKYRKQVPAFNTLVSTLGTPKGKHGKFVIINGRMELPPKRGKNKRNQP